MILPLPLIISGWSLDCRHWPLLLISATYISWDATLRRWWPAWPRLPLRWLLARFSAIGYIRWYYALAILHSHFRRFERLFSLHLPLRLVAIDTVYTQMPVFQLRIDILIAFLSPVIDAIDVIVTGHWYSLPITSLIIIAIIIADYRLLFSIAIIHIAIFAAPLLLRCCHWFSPLLRHYAISSFASISITLFRFFFIIIRHAMPLILIIDTRYYCHITHIVLILLQYWLVWCWLLLVIWYTLDNISLRHFIIDMYFAFLSLIILRSLHSFQLRQPLMPLDAVFRHMPILWLFLRWFMPLLISRRYFHHYIATLSCWLAVIDFSFLSCCTLRWYFLSLLLLPLMLYAAAMLAIGCMRQHAMQSPLMYCCHWFIISDYTDTPLANSHLIPPPAFCRFISQLFSLRQ